MSQTWQFAGENNAAIFEKAEKTEEARKK